MGGARGEEETGLSCETWKVGCTRIVLGSWRRTATGLMMRVILNGPTYRGDNFLDSTLNGKSRVESQTSCPSW